MTATALPEALLCDRAAVGKAESPKTARTANIPLIRKGRRRSTKFTLSRPQTLSGEDLRDFGDDASGVEPRLCVLCRKVLMMILESIGQYQCPNGKRWSDQVIVRQKIQHMAAKPADSPLLHRNEHSMVANKLTDQLRIERLGEARIGNRTGNAAYLKLIGGN